MQSEYIQVGGDSFAVQHCARGYYHAACDTWFNHFDAPFSSWLSHPCSGITAETIRARYPLVPVMVIVEAATEEQLRALIARINTRRSLAEVEG